MTITEIMEETINISNKKYQSRVMISGFFDPIHEGHIDLFEYAKRGEYLSDYREPYVIAVIHKPEDIVKKSGFYIYETSELISILKSYKYLIDEIMIGIDCDDLVTETIREAKPNYFVKGPDRNPNNMPMEEILACMEVGCKIIYQLGKKVNNSSVIKQRIKDQILSEFLNKD